MDVVYMVRDGETNEELRYSLRSLVNIRHDRVWIFGNRPGWVTGAHVVQVDTTERKHRNTWANWRAIAGTPAVSDDFIFMNDDMFVMHPVDRIPVLHAGPIDPWTAAAGNNTRSRMLPTIDALERAGRRRADMVAYELHIPMVVNRAALAEVMEYGQHYLDRMGLVEPLAKRSLYGNYVGLGGTQAPDVKIYHRDVRPDRSAPFLSTMDGSFRYGVVGQHIRRAFPAMGHYDGAAIPRALRV